MDSEGLKFKQCVYNWWDHSLAIGEVLFLAWGIRVCYNVRNAESLYNEARMISYAIYNIAIVNIMMIAFQWVFFIPQLSQKPNEFYVWQLLTNPSFYTWKCPIWIRSIFICNLSVYLYSHVPDPMSSTFWALSARNCQHQRPLHWSSAQRSYAFYVARVTNGIIVPAYAASLPLSHWTELV